jgi:hypothetical protein
MNRTIQRIIISTIHIFFFFFLRIAICGCGLTLYSARLLMTQDRTASRPSGTVTFRMDSENCGTAVVTAE